MKFLHTSDLHLGKRFYEVSLIDDQADILNKILSIVEEEKPNGVIIAGDVYDKSVPSVEAVGLFDEFLASLAEKGTQVFVISGNHDSPERIAFGGRIMNLGGVHLSPVYSGEVKPVTLMDEYGELNVYMLPFVKPTHVRRFYEDEQIESYSDAIKVAISHMNVDFSKRNVLVTHQFVTGARRSESEETVGGTDNVDVSVFEGFDYVALGHLHAPQYCQNSSIRYSGTPLMYSFSEVNDKKSVTIVELTCKGGVETREIELKPMREMKKVRGAFCELMLNPRADFYTHVTLTDENDVPNAISRLRVVYPNAMELIYDNERTRARTGGLSIGEIEKKSIDELFAEFFNQMNGVDMDERQQKYIKKLIEQTEEEL